jgi:beta-N-acetylhexosaminidase
MASKYYLYFVCIYLFSTLSGTAQTNDSEMKQKIAQMLLVGFRGTTLSEQNHIYHDIKNLQIGGVILFDYDVPSKSRGRNIQSPAQVKKLIADLQQIAPVQLLVSIDQEGGKVNRLKTAGFPPTVSARYQGAVDHVDTTRFYAALTAKTLAGLGFNLNFAPCVDIDVNPNCPVIGKMERSFSADPAKTVKHARIWIAEHTKQHILTCLKHFPGHGSSRNDTHAGATDVTKTWTEEELLPYRELIEEDVVRLVMTSHVFNARLDAQYPATMSKNILTEILRKQLRFNGVIVSDDLAMGAIAGQYSLEEALEKAINAGVDLLCLSNNGKHYDPQIAQKAINIIYTLVRQGKITPQRIDESYQRIMKLKEQD